jgi:hypothetical protein
METSKSWCVRQYPIHLLNRGRTCDSQRFLNQLFFRLEVLVKTAVGQPGRCHEIGEADTFDAMLTKFCSGRFNDTFSGFSCFFL